MQNLRNEMNQLVKRIEAMFPEASGDKHCTVCNRIADEFELWEPNDAGGESFPVWLSRVVEGVGNDLGYLD